MRPSESSEAAEHAIVAAEAALAGRHYQEALFHLGEAKRLGAPHHDLQRLAEAIQRARGQADRSARWSVLAGLGAGILGYGILSFQQPPGWTVPVWAVLAFLVVPGMAGWATGRLLGRDRLPRDRFRAGVSAGGLAMALYTAITLIVLQQRIHTEIGSGQTFLVGCLVTLVYAALAGVVAGLVSARVTWRPARGQH
jgi:hypothetical protein